MLNISSVSVSPWPQSTPTVKAQPVTPTKQSKAVSLENAGASLPVTPMGESGKALATYAPSTLAPVAPTGETANTSVLANPAVPERTGLPSEAAAQPSPSPGPSTQPANAKAPQDAPASSKASFPGQLPEPYKAPDEVALERQINEFVPNLWKASRAAVDVLIGEEAQAAAMAARAQAHETRIAALKDAAESAPADAANSYTAQAGTSKPGGVLNTQA